MRLTQGTRTAVVVSVRCANKTYGLFMATVQWEDTGSLVSLPFSTLRRTCEKTPIN